MDYKKINEKIKKILNKSKFDLLDKNRYFPSAAVSDPRKISYFTEKKLQDIVISGDIWDKDIRQKYCIMTKPGKFFKHVSPEITDAECQKMVASYYNEICIDSDENEFEFYISDNIQKYYNENQYYSSKGSLGSSCMRGSDCEDFIKFYNHYDVNLLVLKNDNDLIIGRALIWNDVRFGSIGKTLNFMDRIYVNDDNDIERFISYAKDNGFVYKKYQSSDSEISFVYDGKAFFNDIQIECKDHFEINYMSYPYLDTLSNMNYDLALSNFETDISLTNIDGTCSETTGDICEDCECRYDSDVEGIYIEGVGGVCGECADNYYYCKMCERYQYKTMITEIGGNYYCEDCVNEYFTKCNECDEWIHNDDIYLVDGSNYCDSCHDKNITKCDECDDDYLCEKCKVSEAV